MTGDQGRVSAGLRSAAQLVLIHYGTYQRRHSSHRIILSHFSGFKRTRAARTPTPLTNGLNTNAPFIYLQLNFTFSTPVFSTFRFSFRFPFVLESDYPDNSVSATFRLKVQYTLEP